MSTQMHFNLIQAVLVNHTGLGEGIKGSALVLRLTQTTYEQKVLGLISVWINFLQQLSFKDVVEQPD